MSVSLPPRAFSACFPDHAALDVRPSGEGDYCAAFHVRADAEWMFLLAKHPHADACLTRVAALTPHLAPTLPVASPLVEHHGRADGRVFVGYRALHGAFLREAVDAVDRARSASDFATFFRALHAFDVGRATAAGVPSSDYAFGMRDDHFLEGDAASLYARDLEAYRAAPAAEADTEAFLEAALERHLTTLSDGAPRVLLHGEVSPDHVLLTERGRVGGIIDFNGMLIARPARDFLYLHETFGRRWTAELLAEYGAPNREATLDELRFLQVWHALLRLLWAVEHGFGALAARRRAELDRLKGGPAPD